MSMVLYTLDELIHDVRRLGFKDALWHFFSPTPFMIPGIFFFLAMLRGMWDLMSLTRDGTRAPCSGSAEP